MVINGSGESSVDGALSPYDFILDELKIINSAGITIGIDYIFTELNIYEDLFNNVMNGDIYITDSSEIITRLNMYGNEFISIVFKTPGNIKFQKVFRIYKISEYGLRGTSSATYKIHFCSEEFLLSQQVFVSRSYKEARLSDIVINIANDYLKIPNKKFQAKNIEASTLLLAPEKNPLIVPNLRPLEAINWISSFALDTSGLSPGFFFYESVNGYNFISLSTIYSQQPKTKLYYSAKNMQSFENIQSQQNKLDEMEFRQVFDALDSISNGAFFSQLIKLDLLNRNVEGEAMSISQSRYKTLNNFLPYNLAKNRMGTSIDQASGYIRMFPAFQEDLMNRWLLMRASRLALLNNTRLHIDIPGNSALSVGDIVYISIPTNDASTEVKNLNEDKYLSGKYLITGLRHQLLNTKYCCYAQLCKDSSSIDFSINPITNTNWSTAINS